MKTTVVVNPAAAAGRVGRELPEYRKQIEQALGKCHFASTTFAGEATVLARAAVDAGADRVLSLGGDGTHHEIVNGLLSHSRAADVVFGVLPAGTGGDFRRTVGVWTLAEALGAIGERPVRAVDVGHASFVDDDGNPRERWFLNLASCGMSGLVDRRVNASSKRFGGTVSFFVGTLRAMATYEPVLARIEADGRDLGEHRISVCVVGNGQYAGGGMHFCPKASLTDGKLDLVVLPHAGVLRSLARTPHLYRGTLATIEGVIVEKVSSVRLSPLEGTGWLDLDGESPGRAPVTFRVEPRRLLLAGAP